MGCGGSRADAIIEPRYHESWTRETESTWLTNTDVDTPTSIPNSTFCCSFYPLKNPTLQKNK
uniref:BAALC binder of MAP3K1 and KLF4 b n=1 Tax=Oryzias latipes TaxID=8090 RepID=A0A3B3IEH9_ORYLA